MSLQDYWGIGPKTATTLAEGLGTERAIRAIEAMDIGTLADAGLARGRATRILRHAHGEQGMGILTTPDARSVYKELLARAQEYAITEHAGDRIRVLTPLTSVDAMDERLDAVTLATETWRELDDATREAVLDAFADFDEMGGGERAAVETVLALQELGVHTGVFAEIDAIDADALADAAAALSSLDTAGDDSTVREGVDDELDTAREQLAAVEQLDAQGIDVIDAIQSDGVRSSAEFREAFVSHVAAETPLPAPRVREATPTDAADATDFVTQGLRELLASLRETVEEREQAVVDDLEAALDDSRDAIEGAVSAVNETAFQLSLARFVDAYELTRPTFVESGCVGVVNARNLSLVAAAETAVQPITYAVGEHDCTTAVPTGDRVSVLTGANSGGKTTLLETLCQVVVLAHMGLPVPADAAEVSRVDAIVFHRRHASFNAGVLESTLQTIVPPLTDSDRTLMLVDEFEAITEPGSAADLLYGLVRLAVDAGAIGVYVTHLADDLAPLPDRARTDGIFARGLNDDLTLDVDYQPQFETVGRSTPEFIVSRLVANASDRSERAGFEALAEAVGEDVVHQTLLDAEWSA
ncbi:MutS-related protein [Halococcus thailandensis]|uniref:DNA mismatch repair protein MutS n=1 Tax=Halococcus thailandensis JCM 13552 TaxID=1227457 RepID=M0NCD3_9EURY|nr:DNA mismatch repair protein MutS [Halococcus thailandensis]EMA54340.1 DNA mismatch repair protein MutS [Halococcus thailandensis JCM 13552]